MTTRAVVGLICLALAGCGSGDGAAPYVGSAADSSGDADLQGLAHRIGVDPPGGPLDRFFGVPLDPEDATRWDFDMMQRGTAACMERNGFEYRVLTFDESQAGVDPNVAIMGALGDRTDEYALVRWGVDGAGGCEREASDRAHPLNVLRDEYEQLQYDIATDDAVVAAQEAFASCLGVDHSGKLDPTAFSAAELSSCEQQSQLGAITAAVAEREESSFIERHRDRLENLRDTRP